MDLVDALNWASLNQLKKKRLQPLPWWTLAEHQKSRQECSRSNTGRAKQPSLPSDLQETAKRHLQRMQSRKYPSLTGWTWTVHQPLIGSSLLKKNCQVSLTKNQVAKGQEWSKDCWTSRIQSQVSRCWDFQGALAGSIHKTWLRPFEIKASESPWKVTVPSSSKEACTLG